MTETVHVLITGCARGIGRSLVASYLLRPSHIVVAAVRDSSSSDSVSLGLLPTAGSSSLITFEIDSSRENDPSTVVSSLLSEYGLTRLDIVIANAGISNYFGPALSTPPEVALEHYRINVIGPLLLFQATAQLLKNSQHPKFVTLSSVAGSISGIENLNVENTAYGASKAALNFITRRIHAENENLIAFPINPGWLQTNLGNHAATASGMTQAPVSVEDGVKGIIQVIDEATRDTASGRFMSAQGSELPW